MNTTKDFVHFYHQLDFWDLPGEVLNKVKYLCLDFLGVAARGAASDSGRVARRVVEDLNRPGDCTVIGTSCKATGEYAAFANGVASHSLELDDVENESSLHPGVVVFPTAFAAGEMAGCDTRTFITAVVGGYDVIIRLGKGINPAEHYRHGFHPTATCGVFAATAVASKIFGLSEEQMLNAFGIAGSQAAGSMAYLQNGAWTKRFHPGWASHSGILAALLAKNGFTGPHEIIEGRLGFLHSYSDKPSPDRVFEDLGKTLEILRTSIKPHACCRYMQPPIDGVLEIVTKYNLLPQDIQRIILGVLSAGRLLIADPPEQKSNPQNIVDAQFSAPFGAAIAVFKRRAFLDEFSLENLHHPQVKDLMKKVSCVTMPELEAEFPKKWKSRVLIETRDGKTLECSIEYPKGDPENPLSWEEIITKFSMLVKEIFPGSLQGEIIDKIKALEDYSDLRNLIQLLRIDETHR
ncbi:MAG: MmgE/PrpD family protein [Nitrospira sp.]|nr:MmgE/PrpD family protein [Nitrospira sp.]